MKPAENKYTLDNDKNKKSEHGFHLFDLRRRSIARDLTVSLMLILILVEGFLLGYIYFRESRNKLRKIEKIAADYTEQLSEILAVPLWDYDDQQIAKIGEGFAHTDLVAKIHIKNGNGHTIFKIEKGDNAGSRTRRSASVVYQKQIVGSVEVALSLHAYLKDLVIFRNTIIYILIGSLVVIFIVTGLLLRIFMRKPLDMLRNGIDRVAQGDFSYSFDEIRHTELAEIAKRFNSMAAEIQSREKALQQSERKYRLLAENVTDIIWVINLTERKLAYVSPSVTHVLGYSPEDAVNLTLQEVLAPSAYRYAMDMLAAELPLQKAERHLIRTHQLDLEITRKNGTLIPTESLIRFIRDDSDKPVNILGVTRDMTERQQAENERKELEAKLQRASKMEALGTLAGGVAHDLNNILTGLVSYPEMLLMNLPEDSPMRRSVNIIKKSGERAAAVVQDLLTLARRGVAITEFVNLNTLVNEYLISPEFAILKQQHTKVEVVRLLEKKLLDIKGSPVHLSKSVMNLMNNACEALTDNGKIVISTENSYIDTPVHGYDDVCEGDYVVLTVTDNGSGIAQTDIEKIFEPFYTKKKMGRSGTGLGMAVVWGTVKDHSGYIDVQSTVNQGSCFTLYLPATHRKEAIQAESAAADWRGKGETILVVDDVEEQREIADLMLTQLGYSVNTASSGEEAVEYMQNNSADLLILDMIMDPGIDGLETFRRIIKRHKNQRAIIASGFAESDRVREAHRLGAGEYLKKPYLLEKLGMAVRNELDKKKD
ncbi:response regulator [Desulfococcaceae bacterium HSG9]|nr:response regulator [Desulfococcaceae bacterium HSG9]